MAYTSTEQQDHQVEKPKRYRFLDYLSEFVYGGSDGSISTFAVVAGASGAELGSAVIIILGFANLFADGLSMSVGSYLSSKAAQDNYEKHKRQEHWEVTHTPEEERAEIQDIYRSMGFKGELLEQVTDQITANHNRWVEVMMKEELGMIKEPRHPLAIGAATLVSFNGIGLIPQLRYVYYYIIQTAPTHAFGIAGLLTSLAFIVVGWLKASVTQTSHLRAIGETLLLGGIAAALAYWVGDVLEKIIR